MAIRRVGADEGLQYKTSERFIRRLMGQTMKSFRNRNWVPKMGNQRR